MLMISISLFFVAVILLVFVIATRTLEVVRASEDGSETPLKAIVSKCPPLCTHSRLRRRPGASGSQTQTRSGRSEPGSKSARNESARRSKKPTQNGDGEDIYVHNSSSESSEHDISFDNVVTSPEPEPDPEAPEEEHEQERGGYGLRTRAKKNYDLVTMLDNISATQAQPAKKSPRNKGRSGGNRFKGPGWSATGAEPG